MYRRLGIFGFLGTVAVIGGCLPGPNADAEPSPVPWLSGPDVKAQSVKPSKEITFSIRGMT